MFASTCSNYGRMATATSRNEEFELDADLPLRRDEGRGRAGGARTSATAGGDLPPVRDGLRDVAADALRPDGERVHSRARARARSWSSSASSSGGRTSTSAMPHERSSGARSADSRVRRRGLQRRGHATRTTASSTSSSCSRARSRRERSTSSTGTRILATIASASRRSTSGSGSRPSARSRDGIDELIALLRSGLVEDPVRARLSQLRPPTSPGPTWDRTPFHPPAWAGSCRDGCSVARASMNRTLSGIEKPLRRGVLPTGRVRWLSHERRQRFAGRRAAREPTPPEFVEYHRGRPVNAIGRGLVGCPGQSPSYEAPIPTACFHRESHASYE